MRSQLVVTHDEKLDTEPLIIVIFRLLVPSLQEDCQRILLRREVIRLCVFRERNVAGALTAQEYWAGEELARLKGKHCHCGQHKQNRADTARDAREFALTFVGKPYWHSK